MRIARFYQKTLFGMFALMGLIVASTSALYVYTVDDTGTAHISDTATGQEIHHFTKPAQLQDYPFVNLIDADHLLMFASDSDGSARGQPPRRRGT